MTPSIDRRTLLGAAATGSLAALAGCSSSCPDSGTPEPDALVASNDGTARPFEHPPDADWPAPRHDAGNTGYAPEVTPPEPPLGVRWRRSLPTSRDDGTGDRGTHEERTTDEASAPAVADGRVFVATGAGVVALRFRDGEEAWRNSGVAPNTTGPTYGYGEEFVPPVADSDGTVYVGGREALVALDADDGSERWRFDGVGAVRTPAVHGGTVYAGTDGTVVAVDAADGTEHWTAEVDVEGGFPAVANGTVVVAGSRTIALDAGSGDRRWHGEQGADFYPVVDGSTVYLGNHAGLHAVDLASGERHWTFERGSGRAFSSPVVADETLYAVELPGEAGTATFALDRAEGPPSPRWCSDVGEGAVTAAVGDRAFGLQSGGSSNEGGAPVRLVAFAERFGDATWGYPARQQLLPPAAVDGAVVVVDRAGTVVALGAV